MGKIWKQSNNFVFLVIHFLKLGTILDRNWSRYPNEYEPSLPLNGSEPATEEEYLQFISKMSFQFAVHTPTNTTIEVNLPQNCGNFFPITVFINRLSIEIRNELTKYKIKDYVEYHNNYKNVYAFEDGCTILAIVITKMQNIITGEKFERKIQFLLPMDWNWHTAISKLEEMTNCKIEQFFLK